MTDQTSIPPELQSGTSYRVGEAIAEGGMGAVLRAEDVKVQRVVAMKILLTGRNQDPEALRRFLLEARVLGQLEHPNIVPLYELGLNAQGQVFYTMKLVNGVTLRAVLESLKAGDAATLARYPLDQLMTVFQKVCDAISFAHSLGIIHRDLKPDNIMLGDFGEVLVMDWGLAKIISEIETESSAALDQELLQSSAREGAGMRTMEGSVLGTPYFMAPEQAEGRVHELDARTDIFALGGILYNLLTLHPPVTGDTVQQVLTNIVTGYIAPPALYNKVKSSGRASTPARSGQTAAVEMVVEAVDLRHCPDGHVPEALSAVAMKALAVDPSLRYQSVTELKRDITAYQTGFATTAERAGVVRQFRLLIARNRTLAAAAAFIVLLSIAFMAKVVSSERAARVSLGRLRDTAPAFHDQARSLIESAQLPDALEKIDFALTLTPDEPKFLLTRANVLQTMQRLAEARKGYERVLLHDAGNTRAVQNLELCDKLDKETGGGKEWPMATLNAFQKTLDEQGRYGEAVYLNRFLSRDSGALVETWRAKLNAAGIRPSRLALLPNRRFDLSLANQTVDDLSPLKGMPIESLQVWQTKIVSLGPLQGMTITTLNCSRTRINSLEPLRGMPLTTLEAALTEITDLEPLREMPLVSLNLPRTRVADLTPLKGLPLAWLNLEGTTVTNISALAGMPLKYLNLDGTFVADISPLAGTPLKSLDLRHCTSIADLRPLRECAQLENLGLPPNARDLAILRQMPVLKSVDYELAGRYFHDNLADYFKRMEMLAKVTQPAPPPAVPPATVPPKKKGK